jgi:hypothetical protein
MRGRIALSFPCERSKVMVCLLLVDLVDLGPAGPPRTPPRTQRELRPRASLECATRHDARYDDALECASDR